MKTMIKGVPVTLINNTFFVRSNSDKSVDWKIDLKSMCCNCPGFKRWKHCKHQKIAEDYLNSGAIVDICRANSVEDNWPIKKDAWTLYPSKR